MRKAVCKKPNEKDGGAHEKEDLSIGTAFCGKLKNHLSRFLRYAGYTMKEGALPVAVHFYVFGETDDLQADSAAKISFEERFA